MPKPEPAWWAEARRMRANNEKLIVIATVLGRHERSVCYALASDSHKERRRAAVRSANARWVEQHVDIRALWREAKKRARERKQSVSRVGVQTPKHGEIECHESHCSTSRRWWPR